MKIEQLDKNLDTIMNNLDDELFFVCISEARRTNSEKTYKRITSTNIKQMSIENLTRYIENEKYAMIRVS